MENIRVLVGNMPKMMASMIRTILSDTHEFEIIEHQSSASFDDDFDVLLTSDQSHDIVQYMSRAHADTQTVSAIQLSSDGLKGEIYKINSKTFSLSDNGGAALIHAIHSAAGRS